jgi:hypothetical protein|tara:strand:+ start:10255 stop:10392 length:138 start_codon:yes stop_codon:yes gene_type:complete
MGRILANRRRESWVFSVECKLTGDVDNAMPKVGVSFGENPENLLP